MSFEHKVQTMHIPASFEDPLELLAFLNCSEVSRLVVWPQLEPPQLINCWTGPKSWGAWQGLRTGLVREWPGATRHYKCICN